MSQWVHWQMPGAGGWGWEEGMRTSMGTEFQFQEGEKFRGWTTVSVTQYVNVLSATEL